jgi:hypothetical protein
MKVPSLFIKLMMLTTSPNDSEALTALRKANAMLAQANVNWQEFLSAVEINKSSTATPRRTYYYSDNAFTDVGSSKAWNRHTDSAEINALFESAFRNVGHGGFRDFLDRVHQWWQEKGFLTEKQFEALRRSAE